MARLFHVQYVQGRPHHGPGPINRRDRAAVQSQTAALGRALRMDSSRGLHHRPNSDRPGHSRRSQAQPPTYGTGAAALGAHRRTSSPGYCGCIGARRRRVTGTIRAHPVAARPVNADTGRVYLSEPLSSSLRSTRNSWLAFITRHLYDSVESREGRRRMTVPEPAARIQSSAERCRRIAVVGTTGSGKTTLARRSLSTRISRSCARARHRPRATGLQASLCRRHLLLQSSRRQAARRRGRGDDA
jgi:ABC-type glutathione transport system ATPase component